MRGSEIGASAEKPAQRSVDEGPALVVLGPSDPIRQTRQLCTPFDKCLDAML